MPHKLPDAQYVKENYQYITLSKELEENIYVFQVLLKGNNDIVFRQIRIGDKKVKAFLIYIDGMADKSLITRNILEPIMIETRKLNKFIYNNQQFFDYIKEYFITTSEVNTKDKFGDVVDDLLCGETILLIDGVEKALIISTKGWEGRNVTESTTESYVRGPKEAFVETLRINTSMLRRRIKHPDFVIENMKIGKYSKTDVSIAYIKSIADEKIVQEVKKRLKKVQIDGVIDSGYLEEFIEDNPFSPFPQIAHSEKPDKVTAEILEGKVAILVDGSPFALMVPAVFVQFFQAAEDYYERYFLSSALRILRIAAMFIALLFPSIYIAETTFHQEMIPTQLAISIAAQREGVPFPALLEALFMEITFEILREAGIRLPMQVGQAVSIVGGLVVGQAAVQAGLVSPAMVIVVAMTGIASFSIPAYNVAITFRLLRFIIMIAAGTLGFFGIIMVVMMILAHMASLESFGVPYLSPLIPSRTQELSDALIRIPWWAKIVRPRTVQGKNIVRQEDTRG
ncbi:spore germination protein KA [Thermoanaerobacter uzonensis DSM 18761]|jgi:spore germination protein KA|uniref:Spore germination protein KA n=1 Tax=Thermoanaerobacter uzonensis DSM 18761 TaxID=1123369 RepID=A0A1M4YTC4_9THEO|nr:spore germination protein [Thermoanaerobacter uzonensis]SHF08978.1 spore germination protein KA [Thermoanaerobacter uzonensis DSM 18761]